MRTGPNPKLESRLGWALIALSIAYATLYAWHVIPRESAPGYATVVVSIYLVGFYHGRHVQQQQDARAALRAGRRRR